MANPTWGYPDLEIEGSLESFGGWFGWLADPAMALEALRWKASRGDELPEQLVPLRDALAQFGHAPIEEAVPRVQRLEKAMAEIAGLQGGIGGNTRDAERIRRIVDLCVLSSGGFGPVDDAEQHEGA